MALIGWFGAAASGAADVGTLEPGNGLLEALLGVAVTRIVAGMLAADARHLLLKHSETLEFGFRHVGKWSAPSCSSRLRFGSARKR